MGRDIIYTTPLETEEPVYSFHAFLFPFEWKHRDDQARNWLLEDQVDFKVIRDAMDTERLQWERRHSWNPPKTKAQYNEAVYFYDFVRPVLYDTGNNGSTLQLHYFFLKTQYIGLTYEIITKDKTYCLEVDDIVVSFYDTGVGVLAFHLLNKQIEQSAPDDILAINNLGRRVYPPFMGTDTNLLGTQAFFEDDDWSKGLEITKGSELPKSIRLTYGEKEVLAEENYLQWVHDQNLEKEPYLIRKLLPEKVLERVELIPVLDDRMFVVSWYGNAALAEHIKGASDDDKDDIIDNHYKTNDWWYQYVFVDAAGFKTVQSKDFTKKELEETTLSRWLKYKSFFAANRYSFVVLTPPPSVYYFNALICSHTQTIYYKIALLGLIQRASLMRFSEEVTAISQLKKGDKQLAKRISSLYKQYIRFINRVYFREVTAQEQGIELYEILQKRMRLPDQVAALDREIQELHQYVLILEEDQRNEKLDLLTYFAALFVVPGFIAGYFGVNEFDMSEEWAWVSSFSLIAAGLAVAIIRSSGQWRIVWLVLTALFTIFVIFIYPQFFAVWETN